MNTSETNSAPPAALPALVTPFEGGGGLNAGAHEHNIRTLSDRGVTGFLIAGSTGEGPYLLSGERAYLLAIARDAAPNAFLLCGIAAQSVAQALRQISELEKSADAALVMTPNMFSPTVERQILYYRALADEANKPIWLYTVPKVTGYNLPVEAVIELATHRNIVGIKDSSGMPERIDEIRQNCPDDFLIYAGASRALAESRRVGANGAITASGNYAFELVNNIVSRSPDDEVVDSLQSELTELTGIVEAHGIAGTKTAANLVGVTAGVPRAPMQPLDEKRDAELRDAIAPLLNPPSG